MPNKTAAGAILKKARENTGISVRVSFIIGAVTPQTTEEKSK